MLHEEIEKLQRMVDVRDQKIAELETKIVSMHTAWANDKANVCSLKHRLFELEGKESHHVGDWREVADDTGDSR